MKRIYFTVTNELCYDQRMTRICRSLSGAGFSVCLVGRTRKNQPPLEKEPYQQKRLRCWFSKGPMFYLEFNFRLFIYLFPKKMEGICAIDLDTILPCFLVSRIKNIPRIYDAHELFSEMKEVLTRPLIKKIWTRLEKWAVPRFMHGYCVSPGIADELSHRYGVHYAVIRNLPVLENLSSLPKEERFILYQGAVNQARGLEYLIPSMRFVDCRLVICGDGNMMDTCSSLIKAHGLEDKITMRGNVLPAALKQITQKAYLGINLVEPFGLNQYYSLANKFFDYIHAGIPQITMNFPSYREINQQYRVAILLDELKEQIISAGINNMLHEDVLYDALQANCLAARKQLNWQEEEKKLILFYNQLLC